jgi:hypothetical protein
LREEAQVIFEEQAQSLTRRAQHGQAIDTHAERVTGVRFSGSRTPASSTLGCTIPRPEISSQPL